MPQNKKHHYVTKFYLKRFTRNERLTIYNLTGSAKLWVCRSATNPKKDFATAQQ